MKLKPGDRVEMTREAKRMFPLAVERKGHRGTITTVWPLVDRVVVQRDGLKSRERWAARFWRRI